MILQNFSKKDRFPLPVPGRAGCEKEYFMKKILSLLLAFSLALSLVFMARINRTVIVPLSEKQDAAV